MLVVSPGDPMRLVDDDALLARVAEGDAEAFAVFYRRHLPGVVGYLMRRTGDPEATADPAAEVFAAVLVAAPRYGARDGEAAGWVFGIARNKLLESLRRGRVENAARQKLGLAAIALEDDDLERVVELAASDEATQALRLLPDDQRAAVEGRVLDEEPYLNLAERLECSESVVRQRVSRGLRALRHELEEPS